MPDLKLAQKQLERKLAPLREAPLTPPRSGWLRAIREAMGMTTKQLGERVGVVPSRITALEKAEVTGHTTLKSLRAAAEAMGCTLVYAIVPVRPIEETIHARAEELAEAQFERVAHTMQLEDQALDRADTQAARARIVELFLKGNIRRLWDKP